MENIFIANIGDSDEEGNRYYAAYHLVVSGITEEAFAKLVRAFWKKKSIHGHEEVKALVAFLREKGVNVIFESAAYDEVKIDKSWKTVTKRGDAIGRSK